MEKKQSNDHLTSSEIEDTFKRLGLVTEEDRLRFSSKKNTVCDVSNEEDAPPPKVEFYSTTD